MRNKKFWFQVFISTIFLAYCIKFVDWAQIWELFHDLHILPFAGSFGFLALDPVIIAGKYKAMVVRTPLNLPFSRLVVINFISRFYALFLPAVLGMAAVRWYKITKGKQGKTNFLATTLVERFLFMAILLSFAGMPLFWPPTTGIEEMADALKKLYFLVWVALLLPLFYFNSTRLQNLLRCLAIRYLRLSDDSKVIIFMRNFTMQNADTRTIVNVILVSIFWQLAFFCRVYLLFKCLDLPFGLFEAAWMGSLVMMLQTLPISFSGIGLREGAYAFLFSLYGLEPEKGVVIGLLFFSQMMLVAGVGWVLNFKEK